LWEHTAAGELVSQAQHMADYIYIYNDSTLNIKRLEDRVHRWQGGLATQHIIKSAVVNTSYLGLPQS